MAWQQLGLRLKLARVARGLTQKQVGDMAGLTEVTVMRAEVQNQYVGTITLRKIKAVLDIK